MKGMQFDRNEIYIHEMANFIALNGILYVFKNFS